MFGYCTECEHCNPPLKVGDRVHERPASTLKVRINGAMTIKILYISEHMVVLSCTDRFETGRYYGENAIERYDFDKDYSRCKCDPNKNCIVEV